jgi:hypothetical protein
MAVSNFTSGKAILTPEFRVSFPNVFKTSAMKDGKPSFNLVMLFPKATDLTPLKNALREVATARWGTKLPQLASPFTDGDTKSYAGYEGMIAVKVANYVYDAKDEYKARPGIVDSNLQPIINPAEFYPGCWARATIFAKATGGPGTSYAAKISFGLRNLQKLREDEAFGTPRVAAEEDFEAFGGGAPTAAAPAQAEAPINPAAPNMDFLDSGAASDGIPW